MHSSIPAFIDDPFRGYPQTVSEPLPAYACEPIEDGQPLRRERGVIRVSTRQQRELAAIPPEFDPMPRMVGIRITKHLPVRHAAPATARPELLPLGLENLTCLLDIDHVVLHRHDLVDVLSVAEAAQHDL